MKNLFRNSTGRLLLMIVAVVAVVIMVIIYNLGGGKDAKKEDSSEIPEDTVVLEDTPEDLQKGGETVEGELVTEDERLAKVIKDNSSNTQIQLLQIYNATDQNYATSYTFDGKMYNGDGALLLKSEGDASFSESMSQLANTYLIPHASEIEDFFNTQNGQYLSLYSKSGKEQGPYLDATSWFPSQVAINVGGVPHTFNITAVVAEPAMSGNLDAQNTLIFSSDVYETEDGDRYYADSVEFTIYGSLN
ncbi:MAG: hypothetical protein K6B67_04745 [Lachnospiraceae bacterium]|nr:hypothetical protein [Lachnospiraceae bacterium]